MSAAAPQPQVAAVPPTPVNAGGVTSAVPVPAAGVGLTPSYPMASLYVGDLHPDVTEAMLFDKFSTAGPVLSIRVCRDAVSRRSLGYAYVNFQQPADAERALDTMNFDMLANKPIRIMWSQRDPSIRRTGAGNVFIKNLDKRIDTKAIYDTFSMFGNIMSCKVACDTDGESRGYGFIHFETEESAQIAIEKVDGMLLDGKKVFVGKFLPRATRARDNGETATNFTNVYVKNFDDKLDKEKLETLFSTQGEIASCTVMTDVDGKSKGFGFVSFKRPEDAEKAVNELNGHKLEDGKELTVCRAQKKSDRHAELKRRFEQLKAERMQRYQGVNLYVKNLDDSVDDAALQESFAQYGTITSTKVMCDEAGRSKGFGFVCFEKPEDATNAVVKMNNKMLCSKPLYVALAQRKEDRKAQLASQYMQRLAAMRMQNPGAVPGAMYNPGGAGFFVPSTLPNQRNFLPAPTAMSGAQIRQGAPRWNYGTSGFSPMQANYIVQGGNQYNQPRGPRAGVPGGMRTSQYNGAGQQNRQQGRIPGAIPQGQPGMRQASHMQLQNRQTIPQHQFQQQQQAGIVVLNQEALTTQMLAAAQPQEQKQMLGERLFPLIQRICKDTDVVGKVTGMMLEMENSELLMMLESEEPLRTKVNEAMQVLHASNASKSSNA